VYWMLTASSNGSDDSRSRRDNSEVEADRSTTGGQVRPLRSNGLPEIHGCCSSQIIAAIGSLKNLDVIPYFL
jgi:hypothetical protein